MENNITLKFNDSLLIDSSDIIANYVELGIDSVLEDGIFKEVPVVSTILSINKVFLSIHERNLVKNLILFLNELNTGDINRKKLEKYKEKLNNNKKIAEKELGRVLIILNQTIDNEKTIMMGKLFKSYINEQINWSMFCEFSEIVNRIFIQDVFILKKIYVENINCTSGMMEIYRVERLNSLGIIGLTTKTMVIGNQGGSRTDSYIALNKMGKHFCAIVFS